MRLLRLAIRITILMDRNQTFWYEMRQRMLEVFDEEIEFMYEEVEE